MLRYRRWSGGLLWQLVADWPGHSSKRVCGEADLLQAAAGQEKRNGVVITEADNKWSNLEYSQCGPDHHTDLEAA